MTEAWEQEFDNLFVEKKEKQIDRSNYLSLYPWKNPHYHQSQEVKEFIRKTFRTAIQQERERLMKAMEPAFNDFNAAGQTMIKDGRFVKTGTDIIENIGYMKSLLHPLSASLTEQKAGEK